jgi:hypothetical protein
VNVSDADRWRASRLRDDEGLRLVVADLHNHSLYSDGAGDPEQAFAQLRAAGLDVAALTDHSSIPFASVGGLSLAHYPHDEALALGRMPPHSIDEDTWRRTGDLADAHDVPGEFTALRGFEWTEPWLGHVNVWFSRTWVPVTSPGSMSGLFTFLQQAEPTALYGYNHPGREPGELGGFRRPEGTVPERMVALEAFNRREDYLFQTRTGTRFSPLVECLDAGWRPGLVGSSDEHGRSYGLTGKGRTGLWVRSLSREGVREALTARRAFATREIGLRLDTRLSGVRGGGHLGETGRHELAVDLACPGLDGRDVELQLLTGDDGEVVVLDLFRARWGVVARHLVDVPAGTRWLALRVADPARPYGGSVGEPAPRDHPCASWALAYASPWYLGA